MSTRLKEKKGEKYSLPDGYGQDERSLVKIPFTTIGRGNAKASRNELNSSWTSRVGNREVQFFKVVKGSYGLPEFPAEEVYVALFYFAARRGFESREVRVSPSSLLSLMKWDDSGKSYKRLKRSLNQLVGVTIHTNALWNERSKRFEEATFGIIDDWQIQKSQGSPLFGEDAGDTLIVRWNEIIYQHIKHGRLKVLNVDEYYGMSNALARRLYRWLDEAIYPNNSTEIDVCHLAHNRLEISRTRAYPSAILQSLRPALKELEDRGICTWSMEDSKTPSGKKFVFRRIPAKEEPKTEPSEGRAWLNEHLAQMTEEERTSLESEAVSRLDAFNRSVYREKGRRAIAAHALVLDAMEAILREKFAAAQAA